MIYDVIIVVIILCSVINGYRRGAAHTLLSLVSSFVSYLLATFLGGIISQSLYNNYISRSVIDSITLSLASSHYDPAEIGHSLPYIVRLSLKLSGFDKNDALQNAISNAPSAIVSGVESAIRPIVISFMSFALTILIFVLVSFIMRKTVVRMLSRVFNFPILRQLNSIVGAVFGFLLSLLLISFIAFLLHMIIPNISHIPYIFSESEIYNSYIFYHFYSGNIFSAIASIA